MKFKSEMPKATLLLMPIKGRKDIAAASLVPAPAMVIGIRAIIIIIGTKIKKYMAPTFTSNALEITKKLIAVSIWTGKENNKPFIKTLGFFLKK
jgi:hypothetical protein